MTTIGEVNPRVPAPVFATKLYIPPPRAKIILRPCPDFINAQYHETSYSFPSGYKMTAMFAYGSIAYLIASFVNNSKWRVIAFAAAMLLALVIGLSRIYPRVHYLTDVYGGWTAGSAWLFSWIFVTKTLKTLE